MKQIKLFSALLMCLFALSLTACGDDDEGIGIGGADDSGNNEDYAKFGKIAKEYLHDWADGIYSSDGYMLASYDSINSNTHYYIADKENKGLYFLLNDEGKVIEVSNKNNSATITYSEEGYLLSWFDSTGVLNGTFIKNNFIAPVKLNTTRAGITYLFNIDNLSNINDIMGGLNDAGTLFSDLINEDHLKFSGDLMRIGTDGIIGLIPGPLGISILTLKSMLEGMNDALYERQRNAMYGDCNIKIEEISNDGKGNINVFVTIDKANTIPSHLYHLYYSEPEDVTRNIVYWGVVGNRSSVPYTNFYTKHYSYEEPLDYSASSTQYKMLSFEMPQEGDKYIFRAYLKSLRLRDNKNRVSNNHIKYSEKYWYSDVLCPNDKHVHVVDLGLSVKWACCNVGADSPEEYGDYFAWGETSPKTTYTRENCKTYEKNMGDIDISGNPEYDAATANWGDDWRMPTYDECQELVDECTWQWTTQNGVKGCKVTSKKNGNSIFLPATGLRVGELLHEASDGEYWTDTTDPYDPFNQYACCLYFVSGGGNGVGGRQLRSYGNCIRPVKE